MGKVKEKWQENNKDQAEPAFFGEDPVNTKTWVHNGTGEERVSVHNPVSYTHLTLPTICSV